MASPGMLHRLALVRTDVSEELSASIIRLRIIGQLGTLVTLMMEALSSPKRRFLQEPHGLIPQKTPFFIVTAVKTSNLTYDRYCLESQERRDIQQDIYVVWIIIINI
jgi:hypothetical protein